MGWPKVIGLVLKFAFGSFFLGDFLECTAPVGVDDNGQMARSALPWPGLLGAIPQHRSSHNCCLLRFTSPAVLLAIIALLACLVFLLDGTSTVETNQPGSYCRRMDHFKT